MKKVLFFTLVLFLSSCEEGIVDQKLMEFNSVKKEFDALPSLDSLNIENLQYLTNYNYISGIIYYNDGQSIETSFRRDNPLLKGAQFLYGYKDIILLIQDSRLMTVYKGAINIDPENYHSYGSLTGCKINGNYLILRFFKKKSISFIKYAFGSDKLLAYKNVY